MTPIVVETDEVVAAGGAVIFDNTLTKDGATYDLTGFTVVATIRKETAPTAVVDASLEDITVTVDDPTNGGVTFTLDAATTALLTTEGGPTRITDYLMQYHVTTDDAYPAVFRFGVRNVID